VILLVGLLALRLFDPPLVEGLREIGFDLYRLVEGAGEVPPESRVLTVEIDEPSLAHFGQWPWPRDLLARLLENISRGGPSALALNILLPEADRMSPTRIIEHLDGLSAEARREILGFGSADDDLASVLAGSPSVLAVAVTADASQSRNAENIRLHEIVFASADTEVGLPEFGGVIRSLPRLTDAAAGEGIVNFDLQRGVVRRLPSAVRIGSKTLPSLSLEMLKIGLGANQILVRTGPAGIEGINVGDLSLPTDGSGHFRPRFAEPATGSQISAMAVLAGEVSPEVFRDKHVIVGASASGLAERHTVPGVGRLGGLQLHAQLLHNILSSQLLQRPAWLPILELTLLLASATVLILFVPMVRPVGEIVLLFAVVGVLIAGGLSAYFASGMLVDVSWALIACVTVFFAITILRRVAEERGGRALSRRMQILESTLDTVPVPVVVSSLSDDAVLYANASARENLQIGGGAGADAEISQVLGNGDAWERLLGRLHSDGRVDGFESPVNGAFGEMVALLSARRLEYQEQDAALIACVDISERKRIENALRFSRDKAERASKRLRDTQADLVQAEKLASLGGLVAGVAHEIATPVGIGRAGATHIVEQVREVRRLFDEGGLRRSRFERFLDGLEEASDLVAANIQRAANLIQGFKRVAVDQANEQRQVFELKGYLDDVINSLQAELNRTRNRVEVDCPEEITLDSYPGAIALIVTNFVMNALSHAFDAGRPGTVRFTARSDGDEVELRCSDDGKGMPVEAISRIYDPFFTTRRGRGGSGLGLYLVFNSVTKVLRGRIEVESEEGRGTTFVVRFPRVVPMAESSAGALSAVRIEG